MTDFMFDNDLPPGGFEEELDEYLTSHPAECRCVLPEQSCVVCRATAAAGYDTEIPVEGVRFQEVDSGNIRTR